MSLVFRLYAHVMFGHICMFTLELHCTYIVVVRIDFIILELAKFFTNLKTELCLLYKCIVCCWKCRCISSTNVIVSIFIALSSPL